MADHDITTRSCNQCKLTLPRDQFNKDKTSGSKDGLRYNCRDCQKINRRDWYLRNREREIQKVVEWAKNNPEKVRENDRRRSIINPGRNTVTNRLWRERNREYSNKLSSGWKKENPAKVRASARALYAKDPNKSLVKAHARRVKSHITGTVFNKQDIDRIYLLQKGKCACCQAKIDKKFERDHIIPLALGGTNDHLNIQLLCSPCNRNKSAKHPVDFMQERGFLL